MAGMGVAVKTPSDRIPSFGEGIAFRNRHPASCIQMNA
jgi:hypothetical protein